MFKFVFDLFFEMSLLSDVLYHPPTAPLEIYFSLQAQTEQGSLIASKKKSTGDFCAPTS